MSGAQNGVARPALLVNNSIYWQKNKGTNERIDSKYNSHPSINCRKTTLQIVEYQKTLDFCLYMVYNEFVLKNKNVHVSHFLKKGGKNEGRKTNNFKKSSNATQAKGINTG